MLRNYLIVAVRNLMRHKGHSAINIAGLAVGMAFCILTLLYVRYERSYDTFHENGDRIYRVDLVEKKQGQWETYAILPPGAGPALVHDFPEVIQTVRFRAPMNLITTVVLGEKRFNHPVLSADPGIFGMFTFPRVAGDLKTALLDKHSVVISKKMADKFFGEKDPLGATLSFWQLGQVTDRQVTGVVEVPENSSIKFDFVTSIENWLPGQEGWSGLGVVTYVQLADRKQCSDLEKKLPLFVETYMGGRIRSLSKFLGDYQMRLQLQPLSTVHLTPGVKYSLESASDPAYGYVLSGIALSVLLIACVNFINLSMGLASTRSTEVGIRKVLGASRTHLMRQFWSESILLSFLALLVGLALAELALPAFNGLVDRRLSLIYGSAWGWLLGLTLLIGLLTGGYPALVLSGFHPVTALRRHLKFGGANWFSRGLVVVQFSLTIFLIVATLLMSKQMDFLRAKNLGFNDERLIVVDTYSGLRDEEMRRLMQAYRKAASERREIEKVSASTPSIGRDFTISTRLIKHEEIQFEAKFYGVDYDYLEMLEMQLVEGRNFSRDFGADAKGAVIVNQTLVKKLGWSSAVGKKLPRFDNAIVGVVKDFHLFSLHQEIEPVVLELYPDINRRLSLIYIKTGPGDPSSTLKLLREIWHQVIPDRPFVYSFLDEDIARQYQADERWGSIVTGSTFFAIFIACLGALGLTSLAVARRTKEIGIRKVLGASVSSVVALLSKEILLLVGVANLIAWPVAYYAVHRWLQDFAYRIDIGVGMFALGGVLTMMIVLLTVASQAIKAARSNPVDALRYE
ncbi:MAG: hypothetical protein A3F84_07540 [Candidatus Handelsmanbacteria bacterium RIFCSPLOWO2_12_FULL_64_10]|uniref:ABC transporter permease n=1 Tax=Handelsmanbacteria sp. (strain RIFCSPLOWO2_12_FULL_64_10) TaxID=1817868 RepID=A0A1F6CYR8_HANXR|nr:MAG: hypothetical protein A3F84_07540 [Candidatus Handelsmanbacteria bacterium RIFCSPLOWO2_12_FULL_64_10]